MNSKVFSTSKTKNSASEIELDTPIEVDIDADITPKGDAIKKGSSTNKRKPTLPKSSIVHNIANESKIETLDKFSHPEISVGFYTRTAAQLMESQHKTKGQKKIHTMGLNTFDRKCKYLSNSIKDDNPVADSVLFDIEKLIEIADIEIKSLTAIMIEKTERFFVSHHAGISCGQEYAYSFSANWINTITYKVMWLIKEADIYFNQINLASKAAIITEETANNSRHQMRNRLLNIMHYVNNYRNSNVTRTDIANMTAAAQSFFESEGDKLVLQSEVLIMNKRAQSAPRISIRPTGRMEASLAAKLKPIYDHLKNQEDQTLHGSVPQSLKAAF